MLARSLRSKICMLSLAICLAIPFKAVGQNANAFPAPPNDRVWQREAIQMMRNSAGGMPAGPENGGFSTDQNPRAFFPPVHIPPGQMGVYLEDETDSQPAPQPLSATKFETKNSVLNRLNESQFSVDSLRQHRGPGLQDRIENLLSSKRYQNQIRQNGQPVRSDQIADQAEIPAQRPAREEVPSAPTGRIFVNPANLARQVRASENLSRPENGRSQTTRSDLKIAPPIPQTDVNRIRHVQLPPVARASSGFEQRNLLQHRPMATHHPKSNRPEQNPIGESDIKAVAQRDPQREFAAQRVPQRASVPQRAFEPNIRRVVASDPVLSEPIQDPFADFPATEQVVRHAHEKSSSIPEDSGEISILNTPAENDFTYRAEPQFDSAPIYQDEIPTDNELRPGEFDFSETDDSMGELNSPQMTDQDPSERDLEEIPSGIEDELAPNVGNRLRDFRQDSPIKGPAEKTCEEFQTRLLDNPLISISLDISPPKSKLQSGTALSRTWVDRRGNVVTTAAMQGLSRGYVILDNGQKIARARLSDDDLAYISDFWQIPVECTIGKEDFTVRCWTPQTFTWKASSLCHKPLYFENIQLERYGHSYGPVLQPIQSAFHFFKSLVFLPYQSNLHPPNECQYALGFYRPGDCAPWLIDPIPFSLDGIKHQTLTVVGLSYIP